VFAIGTVQGQVAAALNLPGGVPVASSGPFAYQVVGTVVCGALTFLISINLFRYCLELFQFSQSASEAVRKSEEMAAKEEDVAKTQSLLFEYQLARQSAPMIPTVIWKWNHEWLNRLWPAASKKFRSLKVS
jgi:hypothetical protein